MFDDGIVKTFFVSEFTLDKVKENKAFLSYDTIEEILEELFALIEENKIHLIEEEGNKIKIIFDLPFKKYKNIDFLISEKKKTSDEKINELYNIIITRNKEIKELKTNSEKEKTILEKEIKDLKSELNDINNKLENLVEKILKLEKENIKVLKKKKYEEDIIINKKSDIFGSIEEIDFIIARLKENKN